VQRSYFKHILFRPSFFFKTDEMALLNLEYEMPKLPFLNQQHRLNQLSVIRRMLGDLDPGI
jgi:hypothetical protein